MAENLRRNLEENRVARIEVICHLSARLSPACPRSTEFPIIMTEVHVVW